MGVLLLSLFNTSLTTIEIYGSQNIHINNVGWILKNHTKPPPCIKQGIRIDNHNYQKNQILGSNI
jgi:hypothetical protein